MFRQQLSVQDASLPDASRQNAAKQPQTTSLKARITKTATSKLIPAPEKPKFVFDAICSGVPQHISIGQHLRFDIDIQGNTRSSTTTATPDVSLDGCTLALIAQIHGPHPTHIQVLQQKQKSMKPGGPFSPEHGNTKSIDFGIFGHVPSCSAATGVSQSHKLTLDIQFYVANNVVHMEKSFPVMVHRESIEPLPSYDEAMGSGNESDNASPTTTTMNVTRV